MIGVLRGVREGSRMTLRFWEVLVRFLEWGHSQLMLQDHLCFWGVRVETAQRVQG